MYRRWQETALTDALETLRVLLLTGPRQCGKTTLSKTLMQPDVSYRTLDDQILLEAARLDPQDFIQHAGSLMIIDEVQHVPELLLAIKRVVDEDNRPGQYLLTGSANIQALPGVRESLAGRVQKIRLRPLTQGELEGIPPVFLDRTFAHDWPETGKVHSDRSQILARAFAGGFPEPLRLEERKACEWHNNYIESLLDRDLREIVNIRRQDAMRQLIRVVAAWSSKFMNVSAIGSGLGIQRATLESYFNALEALYLVERLPAWTRGDYDYVNKQEKLFMTDTGLMTAILEWQPEEVRLDADRAGKLLETFVFQELAALIDASNREYSFSHYRDREKREIDFLIRRKDGAYLGIEVKAGSAVSANAFKHLQWFQANQMKGKSFTGIVLYTGTHVLSFGNNCWAIPVTTLWGK